jgi:hypothetical protein
VRERLAELVSWEDRHRRLLTRLAVAFGLTVVVDVAGALLTWLFERHAEGTGIHDLGDAFFFSTVQLLTISSQLPNPFTPGGRVVDVVLEAWGLVVVASTAGSFAAFFMDANGGRDA